ncbi:J domain-containing protein [Clostridium saccharobutylicum]|uniref:Heat shock protein DnaJ domain protein n=1 Tax=Clostridium saccharobutylicum DSM 13864 TaxID=1345695 RepID=U5MSW9_CLOSA|nr:J domain-containing protein [Clostridium saccharobutylicum]AGX42761.1 heat shock protein DnaJ domain protein [Clostridium saccharobutylicum DSM 13864]AQR90057.1 DnaJ domain protein [Clostridium saccharobutylicum]AQR99962.1 DnaJ domain protein [Clostridium saccharobutylicum]AQS09747.1 DnaJ domain protein [Clostridium saccharobutylicum]AQS13946.1 DnaJ domain protein [Clostridium saccharobutylicum]
MDPYEVLGIDTSASEEEIKNKYINLLAEYTKNQDDTTPVKIQVLNTAYNKLINGRVYKEIRSLIDKRNFTGAEAKLNIVNDRNSAEWNYLQGFVSLQKGWFEAGLNYIKTAVDLEPDNTEYLSSLNKLQSRIIDYITKYQNVKQSSNPNSNNMNACGGGNNSGNGGMC